MQNKHSKDNQKDMGPPPEAYEVVNYDSVQMLETLLNDSKFNQLQDDPHLTFGTETHGHSLNVEVLNIQTGTD